MILLQKKLMGPCALVQDLKITGERDEDKLPLNTRVLVVSP